MSFRLVISTAAVADMEAAAIWYEDRQTGLGHKFLAEIRKGFQNVQSSPERYPYADEDKEWRFHLLAAPFRYYKIIYQIKADQITVVAVFHTSQDPEIWQARD
ncbi:MAG: type II toxin-antitoxin system RelE/ParE family toxin [Bacteroidota bacterium]